MSRARKERKQLALAERELDYYLHMWDGDMEYALGDMETNLGPYGLSPYQVIDQRRHDRRVFGHDISDCDCSGLESKHKVVWNQPSELWCGGGHEYHRRYRNRMGRKK